MTADWDPKSDLGQAETLIDVTQGACHILAHRWDTEIVHVLQEQPTGSHRGRAASVQFAPCTCSPVTKQKVAYISSLVRLAVSLMAHLNRLHV